MALGIALELAEFCYFLLLRAGARLLHFWVCRLVGMVARPWHLTLGNFFELKRALWTWE